jgi:hypothetical protein
VAYDQVLSKYSILRHTKDDDSNHWRTHEADSGPWSAGLP